MTYTSTLSLHDALPILQAVWRVLNIQPVVNFQQVVRYRMVFIGAWVKNHKTAIRRVGQRKHAVGDRLDNSILVVDIKPAQINLQTRKRLWMPAETGRPLPRFFRAQIRVAAGHIQIHPVKIRIALVAIINSPANPAVLTGETIPQRWCLERLAPGTSDGEVGVRAVDHADFRCGHAAKAAVVLGSS